MDDQTRQVYIRAAITFLQNSKLVDSPLQDKLKFLKDKGLSDVEVDEALNLALVNRQQPQNGKWNFILILGLCVGGYKLYRACQEWKNIQWNAQKELETKQEQEEKQKIEQAEEEKEKDQKLSDILFQLKQLRTMFDQHRNNFNQDIQSLKTLLLGHEKFAAPPLIPSWQLEGAKDGEEGEKEVEDKKDDDEEDEKGKKE